MRNKGDSGSVEEESPFFVETVTLVDKERERDTDEEEHKVISNEQEEPPVYVGKVENGDAEENEWIAEVEVNGTDISLKLDTGAGKYPAYERLLQTKEKAQSVC